VFAAIVSSIEVITFFRIPQVDLNSSCADDVLIIRGGSAVESTTGEFQPAADEITPVDDAVISSGSNEGITILDPVRINIPVMRIIRAVQICAITWWKKPASPDVEFG